MNNYNNKIIIDYDKFEDLYDNIQIKVIMYVWINYIIKYLKNIL